MKLCLKKRYFYSLDVILLLGVFLFLQTACTSNVFATASLTLSIPTVALSASPTPGSNNGFAKSNTETISVSTTGANWGYNLSIKAKDSNVLKSGNNAINSIAPPTGGIDEETFKSGADYNNKWGFLPSKLNGAENTKYQAGPTTNPVTIENTTSNNSNPTSYNFAIAAKADFTLLPGDYANTFVLTATTNAVSYNITYNLNSGSWSGANQKGTTTDKTITLDAHTPTRTNYEFKGWCNQPTTDETCSGNQYSAGGTYTLTSGSNTVTLYAMWEIVMPATMQSFSKTFCDAMSVGQTLTLKDTRDNNDYPIAKLKDNRCWMTQNLRIINKTISSTDSDITSGDYKIPASSLSQFNLGSSNSYSTKPNNEAAYYGGSTSYGAYYTWQTATAGTGNSCTTGQNASSSICPKNWKLPTSGDETNSDFGKLVTIYGGDNSTGSNNLQVSPYPNFIYAGYVRYTDGALNDQGVSGRYWSSTAGSSTNAYSLLFNSSNAIPAGNYYRVYGRSVRCLAR